jgi:hypothetical protein
MAGLFAGAAVLRSAPCGETSEVLISLKFRAVLTGAASPVVPCLRANPGKIAPHFLGLRPHGQICWSRVEGA